MLSKSHSKIPQKGVPLEIVIFLVVLITFAAFIALIVKVGEMAFRNPLAFLFALIGFGFLFGDDDCDCDM